MLEELKSEPRLKRIPVVVLTGLRSERELPEAYEAHANACLVKPVNPDEFADLIQTCAEFWVSTATLPLSQSLLATHNHTRQRHISIRNP